MFETGSATQKLSSEDCSSLLDYKMRYYFILLYYIIIKFEISYISLHYIHIYIFVRIAREINMQHEYEMIKEQQHLITNVK